MSEARPGAGRNPIFAVLAQASVRQGGIFLGSRIVNGVLGLLQILLVTQAVGPADAGRFFLLWTAAWLLSVVVKFGADGIVPRAVAEARIAGLDRVSVRLIVLAGLLCAAAALPAVMVLLDIPLRVLEIALLGGLAIVWATYGIFAALLKAHSRADLSGIVGNVLWPLGPTLAALVVLIAGGDWITLAWMSLLGSVTLLAPAGLLTVHGAGLAAVRGLVARRGLEVPVHRDEVGAAVLTSLYEVVVWLPVLLGAVLGLAPEDAAGLFAVSRFAGLFSWGYQAVLTVLVPRLAGALAIGDAAAARRTLWNGSVAGMLVTWPLCLVGCVLAGPLLGLLDETYEQWAGVLVLALVARAVDAATGPLGEALLVGRRTWVDVGFVSAGVIVAYVCAELLYGPAGDIAVGIGAASGFVLINVLRLTYVGLLLRQVARRPVPHAGALG